MMISQKVSRGIELANYFLLVPATFWIVVIWSSTFQHHFVNLYTRDALIMLFTPTAFFVLGLALHILHFQYAHHKTSLVPPKTLWLLSTVYNLILVAYLLGFPTFATIVFIWPACIAVISFACFLATYKQDEVLGRAL